jgi:hypothetical protein
MAHDIQVGILILTLFFMCCIFALAVFRIMCSEELQIRIQEREYTEGEKYED